MAEHSGREAAAVLHRCRWLTAAGLWDEWKNRETGERLKSRTMIVGEPKRHSNPRPHAGVFDGKAIRAVAGSRADGGRSKNEMTGNPIHRCNAAPRCRARSKRTGEPCRAPAVRGWQVCRMHGARGGAPRGTRNGKYRHGSCTKEMAELRRLINSLSRTER